MNQPNEGTPAVPEQASQGTPVTPEQPAQTPPATPEQASAPQIPAEVQAQLEALQRERDEYQTQARYHQSRADQEANRVRALAGLQQQADPLAPYLKQYTDMGVAETDAKLLAQRDYQVDQRFSSLQNSVVANQQIPNVMQQVYAQAPQLFQNPAVATAMQNALAAEAAKGNAQAVNADYAMNIGAIEFFRAMNKPAQPQQQPAQLPQFNSQFGPISGFSQTPMAAQKPGLDPRIATAAAAEKAAVAQRFGFKQPGQQ
jgi:hypothetical protein